MLFYFREWSGVGHKWLGTLKANSDVAPITVGHSKQWSSYLFRAADCEFLSKSSGMSLHRVVEHYSEHFAFFIVRSVSRPSS